MKLPFGKVKQKNSFQQVLNMSLFEININFFTVYWQSNFTFEYISGRIQPVLNCLSISNL